MYILTLAFLEYISWVAIQGTLLLYILEITVVVMTFIVAALFAAVKLWAQFKGDISGIILPRKSLPVVRQRRTVLEKRSIKE